MNNAMGYNGIVLDTDKIYNDKPVTIEEHVLKHLVTNGMFADDAASVIEMYAFEHDEMDARWTDSMQGYPPQFLAVTLMGVRVKALEYINEHMPNAWFKPMFEN